MTIAGRDVDFNEASDLAPRINIELFNAENLDNVSGDYAINVNLPKTDRNKPVFSYINDVTTNKSFYDLRVQPVVITLDGDDIITGTLKLLKITKDAYECIIVGQGIDWINSMKQRSIRDLKTFRKPIWSGNRSALHNPWPAIANPASITIAPIVTPNPATIPSSWVPNTVGYSDLFDQTITTPIGETEVDGGNYDFATPLISYGNFPFPVLQGWIEQTGGPNDTFHLVFVTHPVVVIGQQIFGPQNFTIISQFSGQPGGVGDYEITFSTNLGSPGDLYDFYTINPNGLQFRGIQTNGHWFYNTEQYPLQWNSLFPTPYLQTTTKRLFESYGYNVGGDFFTSDEFKNIIIPWTSDEPEPWNWKVMGRINIDTQQVYAGFGGTGNFNYICFNNGENSFAVTNGGKRTQYIRFTPSPSVIAVNILGSIYGSGTPATITKHENYAYDDTYYDNIDSLTSNRVYTFTAPTSGRYNLSFTISGVGAAGNNAYLGATLNQWPTTCEKLWFAMVKRNSDSFLGDSGRGLIYWDGIQYVADSNVIYATEYLDTDPLIQNLTTSPRTFYCSNTLQSATTLNTSTIFPAEPLFLEAGETVELMLIIGDTPDLSNVLVTPPFQTPRQTVSMATTLVSNILVDPIDDGVIDPLTNEFTLFSEFLNPAKWLPDINQADYLKTLINLYNLFLSYDKLTNTININKYSTNFLPTGAAIDWTDKCSIDDASTILTPLNTFKELYWNETLDQDDDYQTGFLNPKEFLVNDSPSFTERKNIDILFNTKTVIRDYSHMNINGTLPVTNSSSTPVKIPIPTMGTSDVASATVFALDTGDVSFSYNFVSRLLKYEGLTPYATITSGSGFIQNPFWIEETGYLFGVNPIDPYWGFKPIPQATTVNIEYYQIWKEWLAQVTNNTNISLDVYLLSRDISRLDLRRPIKIGSDVFIIKNVREFNPIEITPTKVNIFKKK